MDAAEVPTRRIPTPPAPTPTVIDAADAIILNVLSPSSEVPGGRITFPRIQLDTKFSQLKIRIRNALQAAPAPERQRLIYRGHALVNADATLRQVLRPQGSTDAHSDTYTLHLVLPPGNPAASTIPTPAQPAVQASPVGLPQPTVPNDHPQAPGYQMPQHILAQAQAAQMMLQNQLGLIQQQLAGHGHQQQHGHGHAHNLPTTGIPNGMHLTYGIHQGQPGQQVPNMPTPPGFGFGHPNSTNFQALMQQQQQLMQHPALAGHQPMPIAGQRAANQPVAGISGGPGQETAATTDTSDTNGPIVRAQSPTTTRIHETIGPQGQIIRAVVRESVNVTISRHGTPNPANRAASTDATSPQPPHADPSHATMPVINLQIPPQGPSSVPTQPDLHGQPMRHISMPFMMPPPTPTVPSSPSTTMAWILSSPTGPEALLFAPGHGLFSSVAQTSSVRLAPTRTSRHRAAAEVANTQDSAAVAQVAAGPAPPQPEQRDAAQPLARLPHPNAVPAAQLAEENEFFNFIVGRGWLFLRLYVFTYFISEPNTWRRYLLLSLITFVVFLPRENFVQRGMVQVRRHIDALIGPPTPPARDARAAPAQTNAGGAVAPEASQPAANLTTQENATRLLREHEARNPSIVRDILFRIERALAMFLASLVPGVGERHVRAREDQRREAERVENERRTREETARTPALTEADVTPIGNTEASSTTIDTREDAGEARERTTQGHVVETES